MPDLWVRVPASTSNLGPGFDVLGLALDLFLEARFHPGPAPFALTRGGTLEDLRVPLRDDLLVQALAEAFAGEAMDDADAVGARGSLLPAGTLHVTSRIPVGRGLGSSAAALVAGRILGLLLAGRPVERHDVLAWVTTLEGHPDNAGPAVLGGLVAGAVSGTGEVRAVPLPLSPRLAWAFAAPGVPLSTRSSRSALPDTVSHGAAVRNAGRLALLLPALAAGDGPLLAETMVDELHVPYRLPLIPGALEAVAAGRRAGAWAVTLSGAGSGLLAATPPERVRAVGEAMADAFRGVPAARGGFHHVLHPWLPGTRWGRGEPTPAEPSEPSSLPA